MQYALREVRRAFSARVSQAIMLSVVMLLAISGPFGTLEVMPFGPRLAYWAATVPSTFATGVFASSLVSEWTRTWEPVWIRRALPALATALLVTLLMAIINVMAFGSTLFLESEIGPLLFSIAATAIVVALILQYVFDTSFPPESVTDLTAPLLDRLELDKRGALISLSVQDHYVEVTTTKGTSLILLRLSDAIRETPPVDGLQIHRSHWVARSHVVSAKRNGDKALLTLSDGRELPASRSNISALKEAGILPK